MHEVLLTLCFFLTVRMAVPPCYADLGKSAKDIFNKGYGMDACTLCVAAL